VFVAFGRFDEAERLLHEALQQNPGRDDLRLQLLDVYLQSDQAEAFETLAEVIEAGPASPETLAELAVLRDSYQARG
jgi:pilus assembly protein FimV